MSEARHAVVIGGSIGGLCAARVLAERFDRVTVVDRDAFPDGAEYRKGVPQSRHPHALLDGGRRELERLFPGFERALLSAGAHELNPGMDFAMLQPDGWVRSRRGGERGAIRAALVVDASGRSTRVPGWLESMGLPPDRRCRRAPRFVTPSADEGSRGGCG